MGKKIVFLDRDGVINFERGNYTWKKNDFKILEDTVEALKILQKNTFEFIVITNQGGINKGLYTLHQYYELNNYMLTELERHGINILDVFFCPHHPSVTKCLCRKPEPLMLERAIARYEVDIQVSCFIGDRDRDEAAGNKVGIKTIKIESNSSFLSILGQIL